jgi:hypothetical protein
MTHTLLEWDPNRGGARLRLRFTVDVADTGHWTVLDATGSRRLAAGRSRGGREGAKRCALRAAERLATGAGAPAKGEQR